MAVFQVNPASGLVSSSRDTATAADKEEKDRSTSVLASESTPVVASDERDEETEDVEPGDEEKEELEDQDAEVTLATDGDEENVEENEDNKIENQDQENEEEDENVEKENEEEEEEGVEGENEADKNMDEEAPETVDPALEAEEGVGDETDEKTDQENEAEDENETEPTAEGDNSPEETQVLSDEERKRCRVIFDRAAVNDRLDLKGFKILFRLQGQVVSSEEAEEMFEEGDKDDDNTIDFDEFCRLYSKFSLEEQTRKEMILASIDRLFPGSDGQPVELKKVELLLMKLQRPDLDMRLVREKSDLCADDIKYLVRSMDSDGSGFISKQEFVDTLCQHIDI